MLLDLGGSLIILTLSLELVHEYFFNSKVTIRLLLHDSTYSRKL